MVDWRYLTIHEYVDNDDTVIIQSLLLGNDCLAMNGKQRLNINTIDTVWLVVI